MASIRIAHLASPTYGAPVCPWYDDESLFDIPRLPPAGRLAAATKAPSAVTTLFPIESAESVAPKDAQGDDAPRYLRLDARADGEVPALPAATLIRGRASEAADGPVIDCDYQGLPSAAQVSIDRSDAKITIRRIQLAACTVHAEWRLVESTAASSKYPARSG